MDIYIASSWKNQHAVEMLTDMLRARGHKVRSFVENNHGERPGKKTVGGHVVTNDEWVWSDEGYASFVYDTSGATEAELVIYVGPSGKDAAAECGMAWAAKVPILGLYAKGEDFGLMQRMMARWFQDYRELLAGVESVAKKLKRQRRLLRRKSALRKV